MFCVLQVEGCGAGAKERAEEDQTDSFALAGVLSPL